MRKSDGFQVLEYIRSSIEIIMNLKVEDLERDINQRGLKGDAGSVHVPTASSKDDIGVEISSEALSSRLATINPQSFVLQSMKEALIAAQ